MDEVKEMLSIVYSDDDIFMWASKGFQAGPGSKAFSIVFLNFPTI